MVMRTMKLVRPPIYRRLASGAFMLMLVFLLPAQGDAAGQVARHNVIPAPMLAETQFKMAPPAGGLMRESDYNGNVAMGVQALAASHGGEMNSYERWARGLALAQGGYYVVTGLWPIIHMPSFEAVTGPKVDDWLVQTVGGLITVVGAGLIASSVHGAPSRDLGAVAAGSAVTLMAVDIIFVARGRIPPIYLLDAVAEALLLGGWAIAFSR